MKILKSKKALSPVVASIILIAVTVAVSIAVAAWMGALTFTFMGTSSISITDVEFVTGNQNITIDVKNTGTNTVTIATIKVNNAGCDFNLDTPLKAGEIDTITVNCNWTSGNAYKIDLFDSSGNGVGSTQKTAPQG